MPDQAERRRQVRVELIEFLLKHDDRSRALSELLLLSGGLPDDPAAHVATARMYLDAGDPQRAFAHFSAALKRAPDNGAALAGGVRASFALGDYTTARRLFLRIRDHDPELDRIGAISERVLTADPLARGIGAAERWRRLREAADHTYSALAACAAAAPALAAGDAAALDQLRVPPPSSSRPRARPSRDDDEAAFDLVYRVELAVENACGAASPDDRALLIIGRRHQDQ